jgi:hypothetical protein
MLARVLCALPFASDLISGVAFAPSPDGMLSEPVAVEVAEGFARIPGYTLVTIPEVPAKPAETSTQASASGEASAADGAAETAAQQPSKQHRRRAV